MEDHQRQFEQRALKNTRALLDKVERSDQAEIPGRAMLILGGVVVGGVILLGAVSAVSSWFEKRNAERMKTCVSDAVATRKDEAHGRLRGEFPNSDERYISELANIAAWKAASADCDKSLR